MLKVYILSAIVYDGHTYEPGVHEVTAAVAGSLYLHGPARPATQAEIAFAAVGASEAAGPVIESAVPARSHEQAVPVRNRISRSAAA